MFHGKTVLFPIFSLFIYFYISQFIALTVFLFFTFRLVFLFKLKVSAERCGEANRPAIIQQCHNDPCAKWLVKNWSKCKPECGPGSIRKRIVKCVSGHLNTSIPARYCPKPRPQRIERCAPDHCPPRWFLSDWSGQCSKSCGEGITTRQIVCATENGNTLPPERCDNNDKPEIRKTCENAYPCGGAWFVGKWSQVRKRFICLPAKTNMTREFLSSSTHTTGGRLTFRPQITLVLEAFTRDISVCH